MNRLPCEVLLRVWLCRESEIFEFGLQFFGFNNNCAYWVLAILVGKYTGLGLSGLGGPEFILI